MSTQDTTIEETAALILAGQGYELTVSPEAVQKKTELLEKSQGIQSVKDNSESGLAQRVTRSLAAMRIEVEKSRKLVKEPVNRIGKFIDATAKEFLADLELEEIRIKRMIEAQAKEAARAIALAEAEERRKMDEARAAREEAERKAQAAASTGTIADVIAAKQAEQERFEKNAERMDASAVVATTKIAEGVRFAWDYEIEDIDLLYAKNPHLVELTPRRSLILALLKELELDGFSTEIPGLKAEKKAVVSSR